MAMDIKESSQPPVVSLDASGSTYRGNLRNHLKTYLGRECEEKDKPQSITIDESKSARSISSPHPESPEDLTLRVFEPHLALEGTDVPDFHLDDISIVEEEMINLKETPSSPVDVKEEAHPESPNPKSPHLEFSQETEDNKGKKNFLGMEDAMVFELTEAKLPHREVNLDQHSLLSIPMINPYIPSSSAAVPESSSKPNLFKQLQAEEPKVANEKLKDMAEKKI
ncbi:hypothetical protein Tco_0720517 [Tanacetum coccineum]